MMSALRAFALTLLLLLCGSAGAWADVAVPVLSGRVVDQTGTLSAGDIAALNSTLSNFEARKGSQVAVLIVPTTDPESIEQFSIRVAEAWKIGRNKVDDGAILVVAKSDRKLRIEVGYGLEGALTDVTTKRIIDEIIAPRFKSGDFAGGITAGVDRIIKVIDGEPLPPPAPKSAWSGNSSLFDQALDYAPFLLFGAIFLGGALRAMLGRVLGSLVFGGLVGGGMWLLLASLPIAAICGIVAGVISMIADAFGAGSSGGRGGGYSGGYVGSGGSSWSSGSSSSSSDSGSFSGGGGSFGGGGASGSW